MGQLLTNIVQKQYIPGLRHYKLLCTGMDILFNLHNLVLN